MRLFFNVVHANFARQEYVTLKAKSYLWYTYLTVIRCGDNINLVRGVGHRLRQTQPD
jgi:hypothetical protein